MHFFNGRRCPIQILPVEMLTTIFAFATHLEGQTDNDLPPFIPPEALCSPLTLCLVNKRWRNIVQQRSSLWTNIIIHVGLVGYGDELDPSTNRSRFNVTPLKAHVLFSRNKPLNILVNARDPDWGFLESGVYSEYDDEPYTPPFSSSHIKTSFSLLLPHLARWRSLSILTDTWAPMYAALQQIQPSITTVGAPLLESLTLMRCNHFIAFSPTFQPQEMKDISFLSLSEGSDPQKILPRLKHLTLTGVHVHWASLPTILSRSHQTSLSDHTIHHLETLALSAHCPDIRPTLSEFRELLSACPKISKLVIDGSGSAPPEEDDGGNFPVEESILPISFPCLKDIHVGYQSVWYAQVVLKLLSAPNAKVLRLDDISRPGDNYDSSGLLTYLGTGELPTQDHSHPLFLTYTTPDGQEHQFPIDKDQSSPASTHQPDANTPTSRAVFPLLESLSLKKVGASSWSPFHTLFSALPNLRNLEFTGVDLQAVKTLLPTEGGVPSTSPYVSAPCPCPQLQSLCIREFTHPDLVYQQFLAQTLEVGKERKDRGAIPFDLSVHIGFSSDETTEVVDAQPEFGVTLRVYEPEYDEEEDDDLMDCDSAGNYDPYAPGGAFNDPVFDAFYAGRALAR